MKPLDKASWGRRQWTHRPPHGIWGRVPVIVRAIINGILIGLIAANVWPLLLIKLGAPVASAAEIVFLAAYMWWASGGGPPKRFKAVRADYFRATRLSGAQWFWGVIAAVSFAATVHAAIVLLFRFVPFPAEAFHKGYDFSFIPVAFAAVAGGCRVRAVGGRVRGNRLSRLHAAADREPATAPSSRS